MRSEEDIRKRLRELNIASMRVTSPEMQGWIEALSWVLDEKELMAVIQ